MSDSPTLAGLRVLDLGARASTAWCSRLLADYGADVVCAEAEGGHPLRCHPPFDADGVSVAARYFLANKRSVAAGEVGGLLAEADVIVTDALPGAGLDCAELSARSRAPHRAAHRSR